MMNKPKYPEVLLVGGPYHGACFGFMNVRVAFLYGNERVDYQVRNEGDGWIASPVDILSDISNPVWVEWKETQ